MSKLLGNVIPVTRLGQLSRFGMENWSNPTISRSDTSRDLMISAKLKIVKDFDSFRNWKSENNCASNSVQIFTSSEISLDANACEENLQRHYPKFLCFACIRNI